MNDSQLKANLTAFRLATKIPQAYRFVFTILDLFDYYPLLYQISKRVSFNHMKEIKQIHQTHLVNKYFEQLNAIIKIKENKIRLMYLDLDLSMKEILF